MLVKSSGNPLGIQRVIIKVILKPLGIPLLIAHIIDLLNAQVLGSLEPVGQKDATAVSGVTTIAAVLLGGEVKVSLS